MISRRSLFRGLGAILAAPPIAKIASLIPPLKARRVRSLDRLKMNQITREAMRQFAESNSFLRSIEEQWRKDAAFAESDASNGYQWPPKVGTQLRIRLPADYWLS